MYLMMKISKIIKEVTAGRSTSMMKETVDFFAEFSVLLRAKSATYSFQTFASCVDTCTPFSRL